MTHSSVTITGQNINKGLHEFPVLRRLPKSQITPELKIAIRRSKKLKDADLLDI